MGNQKSSCSGVSGGYSQMISHWTCFCCKPLLLSHKDRLIYFGLNFVGLDLQHPRPGRGTNRALIHRSVGCQMSRQLSRPALGKNCDPSSSLNLHEKSSSWRPSPPKSLNAFRQVRVFWEPQISPWLKILAWFLGVRFG